MEQEPPLVSAAELEAQLEEAARHEPDLTPMDMQGARLKRRRRSVEMMNDEHVDDSLLHGGLTEGQVHRLLAKVSVLGDDTMPKLELCRLFLHGPKATKTIAPSVQLLDITTKKVPGADAHSDPIDVQVWVPDVSSLHAGVRSELLRGTHCFVLVFSIKDRASFDNLRDKWVREVQAVRQNSAGDPILADAPIALVATDAEARTANPGAHAVAVPSAEAVQFAQEIGAAKYIECFTNNEHHAREVFKQAAAAALAARNAAKVPNALVVRSHLVQDVVFREHAAVPMPEGTFDLLNRVLTLESAGSTTFFVTTDGSDPSTSSTAFVYDEPIELTRPYPTSVRVLGRSRCHYPSQIAELAVPVETPQPIGYFDVIKKIFIAEAPMIESSTNNEPIAVQLRYTTDGSEPGMRSPVYRGPLRLDGPDGINHSTWSDPRASPPKTIKLVAIGTGMLRSKTMTFEAPPMLPTPRVQYSQLDGTLTVDAPGNCEVRYTLDGSEPNYGSALYTRPVMLPTNSVRLRTVRVACFPRLSFPSQEATVQVTRPTQGELRDRTIRTTKTAMARSAAAARKLDDFDAEHAKEPQMVAPGSRTASSVVYNRSSSHIDPHNPRAVDNTTIDTTTQRRRQLTPGRSPVNTPRRTSSPAPRGPRTPVAAARRAPSPKVGRAAPQQERRTTTPGRGTAAPTASKAPPPPSQPPAAAPSPACDATDNCVNFAFPDPIALSHITVATPGGGKGPHTYEVRVQHRLAEDQTFVTVGSGELEDLEGVQTMHIIPSARTMPILRVQCAFLTAHGGVFQVNDMKVHGKPFSSAAASS